MSAAVADVTPSTPRSSTRASLSAAILGLLTLRIAGLLSPRFWWKFALAAGAIIVITRISVRPRDPGSLAEWVIDAFTLRFLPLMCLLIGGGFLRNEIRNGTIEYLWTRAVRRSSLVLGAYVSAVIMAFAQILVFTLLILGTASSAGVADAWSGVFRLLSTQLACVIAFTAIATALGALTGRYMVLGLVYGLVVEVGISRIPTALNLLSVTHHAAEMLRPDSGSAALTLLLAWAGCLAIAAVALATAMGVFSTRQYAVKGD